MAQLSLLLDEVADARTRYIATVSHLTEAQANWKPSADDWNTAQITEHLFWAEQGGIRSMWKLLHAQRGGQPGWNGELIHRGLPIEEIIARTWQPKEVVPASAAPRFGGPLSFWVLSLQTLQPILQAFVDDFADDDPESLIHPHVISGPLDVHQRLEFLRFHIDRHRKQVEELQTNINHTIT